MKCLLVDDEAGIREGLAALLRRKGYEVTTAADCAAASRALDEHVFDVVVSDWRLPDGFASSFLRICACPAVAISGHPEEVEREASVRAVLQKPVMPSRLVELLGSLAVPRERAVDPSLPADVARLVEKALEILGNPASAMVQDDGAQVVLTAPLGSGVVMARLEELGGDLRLVTRCGQGLIEQRWCRDGRPDHATPVVGPDEPCPAQAEFAVDFHGASTAPETFAVWLDRAVARRSQGGRVHFLNLPEALQFWAISQGRAHDMPMREKVGPRLPAVLADLWSEP